MPCGRVVGHLVRLDALLGEGQEVFLLDGRPEAQRAEPHAGDFSIQPLCPHLLPLIVVILENERDILKNLIHCNFTTWLYSQIDYEVLPKRL